MRIFSSPMSGHEDRKEQKLGSLIADEIERQDRLWAPFQNKRPSLRLGFACLEDEVREALDAYNDDRNDEFCGLGFSHTQKELIQVTAIAIRMLRALP